MCKIIRFCPDDKQLLDEFIELPYRLYADNEHYVPALRGGLKKQLAEGRGMQLEGGEYTLFLAENDGGICGRLLAGINRVKNEQRGASEGYISLFECIDDVETARELLNAAVDWLRERGATLVTGPVSPTNGDDDRGVLIFGFDQTPAVNTSYTFEYYPRLFEACGWEKYLDFHAYGMVSEASAKRARRIMRYGQKKMALSVKPFNLHDVKGECKAIHEVFTAAMLEQWQHLEVPSEQQIYEEFCSLKPLLDRKLVQIARVDGKPVGFVVAVPDYNQVLKRMGGRMSLPSVFRFLYYRRKITRIRVFMQFVTPAYQNTAVLASLYSALYLAYKKGGYTEIEGSTIAEFNTASLAAIEGLGFKTTRSYRIYQKKL